MTTLYRIDPSRNVRRFYRLDIQRDLFGEWTMTREWGRIGRRGQLRAESFQSEQEAIEALKSQFLKKSKRGYVSLDVD